MVTELQHKLLGQKGKGCGGQQGACLWSAAESARVSRPEELWCVVTEDGPGRYTLD